MGLPAFLLFRDGQEIVPPPDPDLTAARSTMAGRPDGRTHRRPKGGSHAEGKKVIALGERDGVSGPAIAACAEAAGAEVVFTATECFV